MKQQDEPNGLNSGALRLPPVTVPPCPAPITPDPFIPPEGSNADDVVVRWNGQGGIETNITAAPEREKQTKLSSELLGKLF